jgi:hypothetical protein
MASSTHPSHPAGAADAEAGWRVARVACQRASAAFGARLISAYAIGSLAHGGFAPDVSDIDIAVLVDHCDASVPPLMGAVVTSSREQLGPGLADRLSIFYGDWPTFGAPPEAARLGAIDRLDVIAAGARMLTKQALFPVRFLYTHATGRAGANQDAVTWYCHQGAPHAALARAALDWRSGSIDTTVARALLERHLDGLYAECRQAFGA